MAETPRLLDVWIVESNMAYREVPFTVVTDWLQEGRLLPTDKIRPSGQADWAIVSDMPALAAFLPRREEHRAEDVAEALEPVATELTWRPREEDDDDVDMIPLIDVSLVLLIFFMMTSSVSGLSGAFRTPVVGSDAAKHIKVSEGLWIGIEVDKDKDAVFTVGAGSEAPKQEDRQLGMHPMLRRLDVYLAETSEPVVVTLKGDPTLNSGIITDLLRELGTRKKIKEVREEVTERSSP